MEGHPGQDWWSIGAAVGTVLAAIVYTFSLLYNKAKREADTGDVFAKNVGAAFLDRSAADDLRRVAENTDAMRELMEDREQRFKEADLLKQLELRQKARKAEGEDH